MKKSIALVMAFLLATGCFLQVSAESVQQLQATYQSMKPALILLFVILAVLILSCILFTSLAIKGRRASRKKKMRPSYRILLIVTYLVTAIVLVCTLLCFSRYQNIKQEIQKPVQTEPSTQDTTAPTTTTAPVVTDDTTPPDTTAPTEPEPTFTPAAGNDSEPSAWVNNWEIIQGGSIVDSYQREKPISFGDPDSYFALPGIATFRGNNYRNSPTYGTVSVSSETISKVWGRDIGSLNGWPGSGWTGQPLIVQWDEDTKAIMNLYESKKNKADLVEVVYATLDGYIYFYDLEDGSYTRDPLYVGMNFKGAGSLDPRGYPILYVGSGDYISGTAPRMYIISLIDGSILYERSGNDAFSLRDWVAFDSSPLVDAETDTLIWPGESGILYTIALNTQYDKAAGTLSIAPEEIVKTRYTTRRSNSGTYWIGYEPSAVIVDRYLYISENGGMFYCIDLNTMELVWAQDTCDDSNSTPVFQWEGDTGYIYTAPSLHWTAVNGYGSISINKINAATGEFVWQHNYQCYTVDGVSGGVQSTPLLGKEGTDLEGLILYTVARTPNIGDGVLVALDTETGETVWEMYMDNYSWSSPIALYTEDGTSYIVVCDSVGQLKLLNAKGEVLDRIGLGSNIEATPTAFGNMIIVGTRGQQIFGLELE